MPGPGGLPAPGECLLPGGGVCLLPGEPAPGGVPGPDGGCVCSGGCLVETPGRLLLRAVRILLECILVAYCFRKKKLEHEINVR